MLDQGNKSVLGIAGEEGSWAKGHRVHGSVVPGAGKFGANCMSQVCLEAGARG